MRPPVPTCWSGRVRERGPVVAVSVGNVWVGGLMPRGCRPDGGAGSSSGSVADGLGPPKDGVGGASLKSPPAALSQIETETVSPTAILISAGPPPCLNRL